MIKKIIAFPLTYLFLWVGNLCNKLVFNVDEDSRFFKLALFFASGYQVFMRWSLNIQDWAKLEKPWIKVKKEET